MLYPLQFRAVFRRYLWGGRRLQTALGKPLAEGADWAESWEIVDRGAEQSIVENGPLAGTKLGDLVSRYGEELLGRHHPQTRFPLLFKFLDANQTLSVQVHPDDRYAAKLEPPDLGKTEAWVVLEALPGSRIYAGLRPGVGREQLVEAIRAGRCGECLASFEPAVGDCVYLPAGTVHALGAGLLVAEIQQSSDVTYRIFDWNRVGVDGRPRLLHIEQALEAIDFEQSAAVPQRPRSIGLGVLRLVECDKFVLDRWEMSSAMVAGGDDRCHILAILEGEIRVSDDGPWLGRGGTILLPASLGLTRVVPRTGARVLDVYLP